MSSGRLYFGGLPTGPDVKRLEERFGVPEPQLIPHEELEAVLGYGRRSSRYGTVLLAWRSKLRKDNNIDTDMEYGVGLRVLLEGERVRVAARDYSFGVRKIKRAWVRNSEVDVKKLDQAGRRLHDFFAVTAARSVGILSAELKPLSDFFKKPQVTLPMVSATQSSADESA